MTERLNELSNNVLITLQSGKKITEAVVSLRELYLYLFKHSVPLPSTTYNYLLNAIQDRQNSRLGNPVICQLTVLVLFQANRPVKQLQKGYTRVGDLLKSGIAITRECLHHLISDLDIKLLFIQPTIWASALQHVMMYSNKMLTFQELNTINTHMYNFIRCNPALVKRSIFSRSQKFYGPNKSPLNTPLTVLCTSSSSKPSPLLLLQAISFSSLRRWLLFLPSEPMELFPTTSKSDLVSEYEVASQAGGASTTAQSTIYSRVTDSNFQHQGIYNDNFYDMRSDISAATRYNPRILNLSITSRTGSTILDEALNHVTLVIEHCTQLHLNSKDKVVGLAAFLECIKILDTIYETCQSVEVQHEILAAMNLILVNLKSDKTKYILLPAALNVVMKHSPEYKLNPEQSEYLTFLYSDVIARSYETCSLMYEIVTFTLSFGPRISRLLQTYIPNIFKIVAYRPTTFAREIAMILPHLYHVSVLKELFLTIVQMPVLSALMLANFKTSSSTDWLLRLKANKVAPVDIVRLYPDLDLVHPRIVAASQLAAVLLKLLLAQLVEHGDTQIFWDCFTYLYKVPDIPGYQVNVSKAILSHLKHVCQTSPKRIVTENRDRMFDFVRKIETYHDSDVSARLVNVLVPPICQVELDSEVGWLLFSTFSRHLFEVVSKAFNAQVSLMPMSA
ncbi:hypothetical protein ACHWQZ_G004846 [Mnemiopsis leidyi]